MEPNLGYYFHPSEYKTPVGHPRLDVNLYARPTLKHFDPESLTLWVEMDHELERFSITHPWYGPENPKLVAGRIVLQDRKEKTVHAFSFGGQVEITDHGEYTCCTMRSEAPIFDLNAYHRKEEMIVIEVEGLLARRRAHWLWDELEFEKRLARIEPLILCAVCLCEIERHQLALPIRTRNSQFWQLVNGIRAIRHTLQAVADWPETVPEVEEIL